jgi:diguanylate cyclase (GGDEF)-like protein
MWLATWPYISTNTSLQSALIALMAALYLALSAWELLRHAPCKLISQYAAIAVYSMAGMACLLRGGLGPLLDHSVTRGWSSEWALLVLIYIPTIAVLLLSMAKERLEYTARQVAMTDPLTLLPNRRAFFSNAQALADCERASPLSCLFFDIDHFKGVNDAYGHQVGDRVLQSFARILCEHASQGPIGRLGGEEFVAFVKAGPAEAERIADHIRQEFAQTRLDVEGSSQAAVTVSVGYASALGSSFDDLLTQADHALYAAKASGRNRTICYQEAFSDRPNAPNLVPFRMPYSRQAPASTPQG